MRYSSTERLGVNETERIVIQDLAWIFREQSIVDVGIDAIIEEVELGNPTGKFLGVQIKTGSGNFHRSDKYLTLYVSNIHYNYWLNMSIPIILVAHLPNTKETCWQQISENTFKKSKKEWKLEIPINQSFNNKSKNRLSKILSKVNDKGFNIFNGSLIDMNEFDHSENISCIQDSTDTVLSIAALSSKLGESATTFRIKIEGYVAKGLTNKDPEVIASFRGFGKTLNLYSRRFETEIVLFSELYSTGVFSFQFIVSQMLSFNLKFEDFGADISALYIIPQQIEDASKAYKQLRNSISELPSDYPVFKEAKNQFIQILDLVTREFDEAKIMTEKLLDKVKKL